MASHTCGGGETSAISPAQGASRCSHSATMRAKLRSRSSSLCGRRAIGARQHAERVFGGEQFVVGQGAMVVGVAHCSRQLFSLIMARRIQLFMVPSGTLMRAAKSS